MAQLLLTPPVVFIVLFLAAWLLSRLFSLFAFRPPKQKEGTKESYACGESTYNNQAQPDYSTFFGFAFFFMLAHVATLVMTTVPLETSSSFALAVFYLLGVMMGLFILLGR